MVNDFNTKNRGHALLFCSERKTHFMNGETWLLLLQHLYTDSYAIQRMRHGLGKEHEGLLLVDGWTGYFSTSSGLDVARTAWAENVNVRLPDQQVGGWSASGQPVDQLHHIFRARLDLCDCSDAGFHPDLRSRPSFDSMPIKASGQPAHPKLDVKTLPDRTLRAWQSMSGPQMGTGYWTS